MKEARDSSRAAIGAIGCFRRVARADWRVCLPRNRVISIDISLRVAATGFFVRLAAGLISAPFHRARGRSFFFFSLYPPV